MTDAWDDDWVSKADRRDESIESRKLSKAERLAKHAELNKKIWDSAESTDNYHLVNARNEVPLKTEFKPAVKVLSRKPISNSAARDGVSSLAQLRLDDDDEDDEDQNKGKTLSLEEMREKAQRDREEKQRRYEEARQRILGSGPTQSGSSALFDTTNLPKSGPASDNEARKPRGRGRGGRDRQRDSVLRSSPSSSKTRPSEQGPPRELFDPSYTAKPDSLYIQKREEEEAAGAPPFVVDQQPIRAPRGPVGAGKGFSGFAKRD